MNSILKRVSTFLHKIWNGISTKVFHTGNNIERGYIETRTLREETLHERVAEEKLQHLNRIWREMMKADPWMIKLMTHVTLLTSAMGFFFLTFWMSGLFLPARHPIFNIICALVGATIPYWLWVGKWHHKIEQKVFQEFTKRFGKNFHLH